MTLSTVHRIRDLRETLDAAEPGRTIGLVPTMGNLHAGHLELARASTSRCDLTVATIFVNPLQFGPNEDLASYPRTPAEDAAQLDLAGVDVLFAPPDAELYPDGRTAQTSVSVPELSTILCGASRPGHFDGVATVVLKLFNIARPDIAFFGLKDYQQLTLIRTLVRHLNVPVDVVGVATVRAPDGLALSSRNAYLDTAERAAAPQLYAALNAAAESLRAGSTDHGDIERAACAHLADAGFVPDYVSIRRAHDLSVPTTDDTSLVVLGAARLGRCRLIDNVIVEIG